MTRNRQWHVSYLHRDARLLIEVNETETADGMGRLEFTLLAAVYPYEQGWDASMKTPEGATQTLIQFATCSDALRAVNDHFDEIDRQKLA